MSTTIWRIVCTGLAGVGLPVVVSAIALGWPADNPWGFVLAPAVLVVMAVAGVIVLLLAGRLEAPGRPVRAAMLILGLTTLGYPCLLALAAAGRGGPTVRFGAEIGHLVPLTMVNLLPILAVSAVTGRSRRGWVAILLLLAAVAVLVPAVGGGSLAPVASIAWLGGFLIPILATWPLLRGSDTERRRRTIVCGLASVIPVVIIGFCTMLGAAERVLRLEDLGVTALMVGFSACTAATAGLVWGATQPRATRLLGRAALLASLAGVLAIATLIVAIGVGLAVLGAGGPPMALLAGVLTTAAVGLGSVLLHRWAGRQIDPRADLESELASLKGSLQREAARADEAASAERRRLCRDLHDGVQAHLLGIALNLQLSGQLLAGPQAHQLVEDTVTALRNAVKEVRALGEGGTPAVLVDDGLAAALSRLVGPLDGVSQIQLPQRRFPAQVEETAYFVACEAIANAVKHARAEHIRIAVRDSTNLLTVMVSDDGVGGADLLRGTGLRGITERVAASGGLLTVRDGSPRGTVVEASLPCG